VPPDHRLDEPDGASTVDDVAAASPARSPGLASNADRADVGAEADPVPTADRRGRSRPGVEARQVTRVIRRIAPWSVVKVASAFLLSLWLILVVASVIVWWVAAATGATGHVESFVAQLLADESFVLDGGQLLWAGAVGGVILVVAGTALAVLLTALFNVLSELTGGLQVSVIEIESARRSRT
jgi:hypothetical protein